jgi:CRP/FNR family transcriptional regulator, cyclic AMP receptor protein
MVLDSEINGQVERREFLRSTALFAPLNDPDIDRIAADLLPVNVQRCEVIFNQDDPSHSAYIVRSGKVRIYRSSPCGNETSINVFQAGSIIGEFAALDQQPRSATAVAITNCLLWELPSAAMSRYMRSIPELSLAMSRLLVQKLRWTAAYAETIAQYNATGRLLHILLLYNAQFGEAVEPGKRYLLDLALTQDDLASLVGARREWINRLLQDWRRQGLLMYDAGKIIILNLPAVEAERNRHLLGSASLLRPGGQSSAG